MKTVSFKFQGKEWKNIATNNSGWIAPGAPAELVALLKVAPRAGYTSKGCPIVKDDNGHNIYLGASELHQGKNEVVGSSGSSGPKVSLAMPEAVLLDLLKFSDQLSEASLAFLTEEKAKLDLGNLSEDQLKALEVLGFNF